MWVIKTIIGTYVLSVVKLEIEKFDGKSIFGLWTYNSMM